MSVLWSLNCYFSCLRYKKKPNQTLTLWDYSQNYAYLSTLIIPIKLKQRIGVTTSADPTELVDLPEVQGSQHVHLLILEILPG